MGKKSMVIVTGRVSAWTRIHEDEGTIEIHKRLYEVAGELTISLSSGEFDPEEFLKALGPAPGAHSAWSSSWRLALYGQEAGRTNADRPPRFNSAFCGAPTGEEGHEIFKPCGVRLSSVPILIGAIALQTLCLTRHTRPPHPGLNYTPKTLLTSISL
jgi:hypothetical protein